MEDIDLQFDIEGPFDTDKKTKKPFPGDFSFNADGLLEDCAVEEIPEMIQNESQKAISYEETEEEIEPFTDDFEDVVLPDEDEEALEELEEVVSVEETENLDDFDDEDDLVLWDEFRSVFEEELPEAVSTEEPETEDFAEDAVIEEPETEESPEIEEEPVFAEALFENDTEEEAETEEKENEEDLTLLAEVPAEIPEENLAQAIDPAEVIAEEPEFEEEPAIAEDPATEEIPVFETDDMDDDFDDDFDFPEDPDTECDFVAVPKPTVSVTTWERVRARASASKNQNTYETEHFFAVEEDYTENAAYKTQTPAAQVMGISDETPESKTETESVHPIWYVDEPGSQEDLDLQVSDEEMDYDDIFNDDRVAYRKKKKRKNILKKILKEFALFLAIIIAALFLVTNFTVFVSRQNTVVGHSMEPTLHGGTRVYTTLLPYIFGEPEVGDIIVFDYSRHGKDMGYFHMMGEVLKNNRIAQFFQDDTDKSNLDEYWIKRVVAVAGDTVSFQNNQFIRNGEVVEEDYILEQTVTDYVNGEELVVPEGCVFVMGDNRNNSTDSRIIGCIDIDIITGKVWKKG